MARGSTAACAVIILVAFLSFPLREAECSVPSKDAAARGCYRHSVKPSFCRERTKRKFTSKRTKRPRRTPTPAPTPTRTATRTPTPSPTPTITPLPAPIPPVPLLGVWESNMKTYGAVHCANLAATSSLTEDQRLTATQYDAEAVFYRIRDYTNDESWNVCAERAEVVYRDNYVIANNGVIPGYWIFTRGLALDWLKKGDALSRSTVALISKNAAYAADYTPLSWTVDESMSREVAYAILSYVDAESVGEAHRSRTEELVTQALGHIDQWFVHRTAEYVRPFMFSLTAEALITYHSTTNDPRVLPAIITGANWIWDNCWLPDSEAFKYTDRIAPSGGTEPAPDLNLMLAPIYAWLWHKTGDQTHLERADKIFAGGVAQAWLAGAKQFNQNYRYSFDYLKWRDGG